MAQPNFRTNKPQDVEIAGSKRHITYSGKCVICNRRCYAGMESAYLEHCDSSLEASDYDMTGPDVMLCFMCGHDKERYDRALRIAYGVWGAAYMLEGVQA